jgi:hypothetical protein
MQLDAEIILSATIKSLRDVVAPAVDTHNKLAQEQIQVAIGLLSLLAQRLPQQFCFACDELQRLLQFSDALDALPRVSSDASDLSSARTYGADVLQRAQADPSELQTAIKTLRAATSTAVDTLYKGANAEIKDRLKTLVLEHSAEQLARDRAWVIAQGWEAHPETLTPIETLLGITAPNASSP